MEKSPESAAVAPVELNISSQVEPLSSPLDEALEVSTYDSSSYVKGWRLHMLSLRSTQSSCPWI